MTMKNTTTQQGCQFKERPILFNADMVRAILEGRKTQTRRALKNVSWMAEGQRISISKRSLAKCPYGLPGDRLWVRERFRVGAWREDRMAFDYYASPELKNTPWCYPKTYTDNEQYHRMLDQTILQCYQAKSNEDPRVWEGEKAYEWNAGEGVASWRSSRHMPRWASRITLEITDVRVERLQDISEEDARAEGVNYISSCPYCCPNCPTYVSFFKTLWDSIYGTWSENPWVLVVEFRVMEGV